MDFNAWIRQPTTLHGLAIVAAGIGVALTHLATGNPTYDAIIGVIAYVAMHLGIDDNSVAEKAVSALTTDVIAGAPASKIMADASPLVSAVVQPQGGLGGVTSAATACALLLAGSLGLAACAPSSTGGALETAALTTAGVNATAAGTIVADANFGATLACELGGSFVAVTNAMVAGATAQAVATVCDEVSPGSVPAPAPAGATMPAVNAATSLIAMLDATKG